MPEPAGRREAAPASRRPNPGQRCAVYDGDPPPFGIVARGCDVDQFLHREVVSERWIEQVGGGRDGRDRRVASQSMPGFSIEASHHLGIGRCQEQESEPSIDVPDEPMVVQCTFAKSGADEPGKRAQCVAESDRVCAVQLHHRLAILAALMI